MLASIIAAKGFKMRSFPYALCAFGLLLVMHHEVTPDPQEWSFGAILPVRWPAISRPHDVLIGTAATLAVAALFRTAPRPGEVAVATHR